MQQATPAMRTYRATIIPPHIEAAELEQLADAGLLPTHKLSAPTASAASNLAHLATGRPVLRVERLEA